MKNLCLIFLFVMSASIVRGATPTMPRTLAKNLEYRISFGDIPHFNFRIGLGNGASITEGAGDLLNMCLNDDRDAWAIDSFSRKILHLHPFSTISCREESRSGLHLRFVMNRAGKLEAAWAHFDLCGSKETNGCHLGELVRNKATLGQTDQDRVYVGLVKRDPSMPARVSLSSDHFNYRKQFHAYLHRTLEPSAIASATGMAGLSYLTEGVLRVHGFRPGFSFQESLDRHLFDMAIRNTVEFSFAIALRQDLTFKPCATCDSTRQRVRYAITRSFLIDGNDGNREFAFPRLPGAFATAFIEGTLYPGARTRVFPMQRAETILAMNVVKSFYAVFGQKPVNNLKQRFAGLLR